MIRTWFKANGSGLILMILLLAAFALVTGSAGSTIGNNVHETHRMVGWPTVLESRTQHTGPGAPRTDVTVHWPALLMVVATFYAGTMPLGRLINGGWGRLSDAPQRVGWRRPMVVLLLVIACTVAGAFVAAVITSKRVWGYHLSRPELDARVRGATKLVSLTRFVTEADGVTGRLELRNRAKSTSLPLGEYMASSDPDDYYSHLTRAVDAMQQRNLAPSDAPGMPPEKLAGLHALVDGMNLLDPGDPSWVNRPGAVNRAKHLRGDAIEFDGPGREPLLLISASGAEVSNDHYPYYEFLFDRRSDPPRLLSSVRFYYDSAGMEGFEWPAMLVIYSVLGLALVMPVTILVMIVRRLRERSRLVRRGFPVELAARTGQD
jgi:hypothetical protein